MQSLRRHGQSWYLVPAPAMTLRMPVVLRAGGRAALDWMPRGACRREEPELFFPVGLAGPAPLQRIIAAKAVCGRCPVCLSCLSYASMTRPDGIWGGTTEAERRAMRRSPGRRRGWPAAGWVTAVLARNAAARHPGAPAGVQ